MLLSWQIDRPTLIGGMFQLRSGGLSQKLHGQAPPATHLVASFHVFDTWMRYTSLAIAEEWSLSL